MRLPFTLLSILTIVLSAARPGAAATLDRIRHDKLLRCGSAIRPGLAFPAVDHTWHGLHIDLCRAIAAAVLGEGSRIDFTGYARPGDFNRIRSGEDDVTFLTATEMYTNDLFAAVLPGPSVFEETTAVMVWTSRRIGHVADLGATMVCVEPGTGSERNLLDYATAHGWPVRVSPWMEMEEMVDAFSVGRCPAVAGEATALAALRLSSAGQGHPAAILPEPLAATPVMAASRITDPAWALVVRWTIETVMWAGQPAMRADAHTLPIPGASLGLPADWQARALAAAGSYDAIYLRNLGADSVLDLPPGLNGSWRAGGTIVAPAVE